MRAGSAPFAGLRLAVAGLWFRRSTAVIVLALATVASAAAVVAPLYAQAAEESILRNTLTGASAFDRSVHIAVPSAGGGVTQQAQTPGFALRAAHRLLAHPGFGTAVVSLQRPASTDPVYLPAAGPFAGGGVAGALVERADACPQLRLVSGRCPSRPLEVIMSRRSLALIGASVGQTLRLAVLLGDGTPLTVAVVGAYDPVPVDNAVWVGRPWFTAFFPHSFPRGLGEVPPTADPAFLGPGSADPAEINAYVVDVPLNPQRITLADTALVRRQVARTTVVLTRDGLSTESRIPSVLDRAAVGRSLVRVAAPLAVTQLVLLSWWTLYLVVGSATEERSPELGLARLRGLAPRQTRTFGLAEVFLLLLVAAPLGTVLGWLLVRAAAGRVFAPGTVVTLTSTSLSVVLTVAIASLGGLLTAALAARTVLRRPVSELLRRVPPRRAGRGAGIVEAVVVVLAIAGVVQLASDRGGRPSPVALLGPGMIAVAGGLLAGRLLVRVARRRTTAALARGRVAGVGGWAAIARRPGTARIASVVAVATCLLLVGVQAWSVAERNRHERAAAETGAEVVLHVLAPGPESLLREVRAADPGGTYAMAAVAVRSSNQQAQLLAVDASRADRVVAWGAPRARPTRTLRSVLLPPLPAPLAVNGGRLTVDLDAQSVTSPSPLLLTARVGWDATPASRSERVTLGPVAVGPRTYSGALPSGCTAATRCRLAALGFSHAGIDLANADATVVVTSIEGAPLGGAGTAVGDWRPGSPTLGGPVVTVGSTPPGLLVRLRARGGPVAEVVHGDSPDPLPALVTAGVARVGTTTGLGGESSRFAGGARAAYLPSLGPDAVLVDLALAAALTENPDVGDREVWLSKLDLGAERRLRSRLAQHGITVTSRDTRAQLERTYAEDGAVLALRLLLVCGAAAVLVAVGALLVSAYVGRRQRAYEVAALRVVGIRRRTLRRLLLVENVGALLVALGSGAAAAAVAVRVLLPALPQSDVTPSFAPVRFAPAWPVAGATLGGLAVLLVAVGLTVAALQLRSGRPDRLREGVR